MGKDPRHTDAVRVMTSLEEAGFPARLAGGCVRDRLMGRKPADYDVATTALPDEVMAHFRRASVKVVPTGIEHGTVTLVLKHGPIEVTTLRKDVETDGRRAKVVFGKSFEEDAARRDFTINAMYEDRSGEVFDYFSGKDDLKASRLRFVGAAERRIAEDYLRILRLFRFWARFGFAPVAGTLEAVASGRHGLAVISQERITAELWKTLLGRKLEEVLAALHATQVWDEILPERRGVELPPLTGLERLAKLSDEHRPAATLAYLLRCTAPLADSSLKELGMRLRLANTEQKKLVFAASAEELLNEDPKDVAASLDFVDKCEEAVGSGGFEAYVLPLLEALCECRSGEAVRALNDRLTAVANDLLQFGHRRTAKLPLDGKRLMRELGLAPGRELGDALSRLRRSFRNGAWLTADEGLSWLRGELESSS